MSGASALRILFRLTAALPLIANRGLGWMVGRVMYWRSSKLLRVTRRNLELCFPEQSSSQRDQLAQRMFVELGKSMAETGPIWYWNRERLVQLISKVEGIDALHAGHAAGKGVILAIPHLGAWEMIPAFMSRHYPMAALYRPPRVEAMEPLMLEARARFGAEVHPTDTAGIRGLMRALKRGDAVAILPDQDPGKKGEGVFAPFFGIEAYTMTLVARLARKTGARVLLTCCAREPGSLGYRMVFEEIGPGIADSDLTVAATVMNQAIERAARRWPEQYQWAYKRFKTRPKGEPRRY